MVNNRNTNFIFINYMNIVNKTLNQTISDIRQTTETNSISHDFINQILPHQKFALKIAKTTLYYTKEQQVLAVAHDICDKYPEVINDMQEIKNISGKFKNCNECIADYRKDFQKISQTMFSDFKKINCKQNINIYFLKSIKIYCEGKSKIIKNLLKYRICPQLRLIAEYMLRLSGQELKRINSNI